MKVNILRLLLFNGSPSKLFWENGDYEMYLFEIPVLFREHCSTKEIGIFVNTKVSSDLLWTIISSEYNLVWAELCPLKIYILQS